MVSLVSHIQHTSKWRYGEVVRGRSESVGVGSSIAGSTRCRSSSCSDRSANLDNRGKTRTPSGISLLSPSSEIDITDMPGSSSTSLLVTKKLDGLPNFVSEMKSQLRSNISTSEDKKSDSGKDHEINCENYNTNSDNKRNSINSTTNKKCHLPSKDVKKDTNPFDECINRFLGDNYCYECSRTILRKSQTRQSTDLCLNCDKQLSNCVSPCTKSETEKELSPLLSQEENQRKLFLHRTAHRSYKLSYYFHYSKPQNSKLLTKTEESEQPTPKNSIPDTLISSKRRDSTFSNKSCPSRIMHNKFVTIKNDKNYSPSIKAQSRPSFCTVEPVNQFTVPQFCNPHNTCEEGRKHDPYSRDSIPFILPQPYCCVAGPYYSVGYSTHPPIAFPLHCGIDFSQYVNPGGHTGCQPTYQNNIQKPMEGTRSAETVERSLPKKGSRQHYKTKMCPKLKTPTGCNKTPNECPFAHTLLELRSTSAFYKKELCAFWLSGYCKAKDSCRHAHGYNDIRSA